MCKVDPYVRLSALNNGETKCVIFVDSAEKARAELKKYCTCIVGAYPFISGFGAHVSVHKLDDLSGLSCVKAIAGHTTVTTCMLPPSVALNTEITEAAGCYGQGITAAVIDTGIRPHADLYMPEHRVRFVDLINGEKTPYDDNGHGTAVASILGGNGLISNGKFKGIAPKAGLLCIKAISGDGQAGAFHILEAMQYIYDNRKAQNIRVVCMSFGSEPALNGSDPLSIGAEALWRSGIVVVASAGNDGPKSGTIKSPGVNPSIITVGGANIDTSGITVPDFSSRGPAGGFIKPDIIAPAVDIAACGASENYTQYSGTSMAAPIVAGAAALILSKNPNLTPDRVKELMLTNAVPVALDKNTAGYGLLSLDFINGL